MAFFSKLKDKLFKSSSKLEEGLDAIVEEGAEEIRPTDDTRPPEPGPTDARPTPPAPDTPFGTGPVTPPAVPPAHPPEPHRAEAAPLPTPPEAEPEPQPKGLLGRLFGR
ncbi:signal recognition particle-docking protein FtsY, partial [Cribrihabitans sp. XS_ASV171]